MKQLAFFLSFCLFPVILAAQVTPESLQWSDFKGKPDVNSPFDATIFWRVKYSYSYTFTSSLDTLNIKPTATYFMTDNSWVKPSKQSAELLNHERGHYKFAELVALEFVYEIKRITYLRSTYKQKLDTIFNAVLRKYVDLEKVYDKETKHLFDRKSQKKWDIFLDERRGILNGLTKSVPD